MAFSIDDFRNDIRKKKLAIIARNKSSGKIGGKSPAGGGTQRPMGAGATPIRKGTGNFAKADGARVRVSLSPDGQTKEKFNTLALYLSQLHILKDGPVEIAGRKAVSIIKKRTLAGISIHGKRFSRLKRKGDRPKRVKGRRYSERKARAIRSLPKPPGATVAPPLSNLYLTGNLYRSIRFWKGKVDGGVGFVVGVNRGKTKMEALALGRADMKARPFIGLNKGELEIVTTAFLKNINRRFRKILVG